MDKIPQDRTKTTGKQLLIVLFASLLSPMLRVIPEQTAKLAGAGGWVSPLLGMPVVILAALVIGKTIARLPAQGGLPQLYETGYGKILGRGASILTGLWLLVTAASALRFYGEGFLSSIYPDTDIWLFLIGIMVLVWWICGKGMNAICRMGQIFFYILIALAGGVVLLGIREIHLYHVWPVWLEGWDQVALSAVPVVNLMGSSLVILFCRGEVTREPGGMKQMTRWLLALAAVLALLGLVIIGMFGWQTAVRLQMPFFSAAKEVTVLGVFERVEAIIVATWVLSDLTLQALLLWTGVELISGGREKSRRWLRGLWAVIAVVAAVYMAPNDFELSRLWEQKLRWVDSAVCYGLPLIACVFVWIRRKWTQHLVDKSGRDSNI